MYNSFTDCYYSRLTAYDKIAYPAATINATGYYGLKVSFKYKVGGVGDLNDDYLKVVYSLDGTTWNDVVATKYNNSPSTWQTVTNLAIPAACENTSFYIGFRWVNDADGAGDNAGPCVDDIVVTGVLPSPCNSTPAPGNTVASANPVCSGTDVTLSLENNPIALSIQYQWQSSDDGSVWTDISGATNSTYTTSIYSDTYYRCIVECPTYGIGVSNSLQVNVSLNVGCYCTISAYNNSAADGITYVGFNTISNTTTGNPAYSDYTSISTDLTINLTYPISVRANTNGGWTYYHTVWIDWNQNSVFEASERYNIGTVYNQANGLSSSCPFNITVPSGAALGTTFMRVVSKWADYITGPCLYYPGTSSPPGWEGEAEDYRLNILPNNCSGTPVPGSTISTSYLLNAGEYFTLSLSNTFTANGITYQWQSSSDGTTWANISGATSATLTTIITADTYFQCVVACSYGGTNTSEPTLVEITGITQLGSVNEPTCPSPNSGEECINTSIKSRKTQFLLRAAELLNLGLSPVNSYLNSLSLYVTETPGMDMNNFTISIKHTSLSAFTAGGLMETGGFTTVFSRSPLSKDSLTAGGWRTLHFDNPFTWNGTDNIIIEFCFANSSWAYDGTVLTYNSAGFISVQTRGSDYYTCVDLYGVSDIWDICRPLFRFDIHPVIPLPVKTSGMTYHCQPDGTVLLKWITMSEINNDYFSIERLGEHHLFTEISNIKGAGTSNGVLEYSVMLPSAVCAGQYLRLKQVDYNGEKTIINTLFVDCEAENINEPFAETYPNPFRNNLVISYAGFNDGMLTIRLSDMLGRVIYETVTENSGQTIIAAEAVKPGLYIYTVSDSNQEITGKVIKN